MQNVFDKDTSRWVMKRAHELAKKNRSLGRRMRDGYIVTYADCFKMALKQAHGEAKELNGRVRDAVEFVRERLTYVKEHPEVNVHHALDNLESVWAFVTKFDVFAVVDFHKAYRRVREFLENCERDAERFASF